MSSEFERTWLDFLAAYEQGNDAAALERLNAWERVWDRTFWARDFRGWEAVYHPDVEIENRTRFFDSPSGLGVERFKQLREEVSGFSSLFTIVRPLSGIPIRFKGGLVWTLEGRMIRRVQAHTGHNAALRSLDAAERGTVKDR